MELDFKCSDLATWKEALSTYESKVESLNKPDLVSLDQWYRFKLPSLLHERDPNPYITTSELSQLMKWKLSRGKWRPRLLDFVSSLDDSVVKTASEKAFLSLPDISKAVKELTVLKGVGAATASAVLAAYAPDIAPFMSDEAMEVALGNSKDYSLKRYLLLVTKLQEKAKELKLKGEWDGPSDIERALWSCNVRSKSKAEKSKSEPEESKSKPEKSKSLAEKSKPKPEKSKSQPEESKSKPEKSKSLAEKSKPKPEKSKSQPEKSKSQPEESKSKPEKSKSQPEKSKSQPEKSSSGKKRKR